MYLLSLICILIEFLEIALFLLKEESSIGRKTFNKSPKPSNEISWPRPNMRNTFYKNFWIQNFLANRTLVLVLKVILVLKVRKVFKMVKKINPKNELSGRLEWAINKNLFMQTILHKIYGTKYLEQNWLKQKTLITVLWYILIGIRKFYFWKGSWAQSSASIQFWPLPTFS